MPSLQTSEETVIFLMILNCGFNFLLAALNSYFLIHTIKNEAVFDFNYTPIEAPTAQQTQEAPDSQTEESLSTAKIYYLSEVRKTKKAKIY